MHIDMDPIFDLLPDAVLIVSADGLLLAANAQAESLFGLSREAWLGAEVEMLIPERFHSAHRQLRQQYVQAPSLRPMGDRSRTLFGRRGDGSEFPIDVMLGPARLADQDCILAIVRDISQAKRAEQEIQRLNQALTDSNHLLESQAEELRRLALEAETANSAKDAFLANVSHELRTPLNGILGMAQLLQETALNPTQQHYVDVALSSGRSLLALINDLLDLSRAKTRRFQLESRPLDLPSRLQDFVEPFRLQARQQRLDFSLQLENVPADLYGDSLRLEQVLSNLLGNALKFTPQGRISLTVRLSRSQSQLCWLRFEVRDSGIGVSAAAQQKIFQPFTQADDSFSRQYGGSGLGLAICREIVELMGGSIYCESEPGQGSCFICEIPFRRGFAATAPSLAPPAKRQPIDGEILLVEDAPINRTVTEAMLTKLGYRVQAVENGKQALLALKRQPFALVLMDCQMPEMDGLATTRLIRSGLQQIDPAIPIVALTAQVMPGDRENCLAAGMNDYLAKPFSPEQLAEILWRQLGRS